MSAVKISVLMMFVIVFQVSDAASLISCVCPWRYKPLFWTET